MNLFNICVKIKGAESYKYTATYLGVFCLVVLLSRTGTVFAQEETVADVEPVTASKDQANPEKDEEVWESYSDYLNVSAAAKEVTNGVRVQDIVEPTSDYRYAAFGKEDPFIPPYVEQSISVRLVSPLQEYDLNQLTLVGVWQAKGGERKAMVRTEKNEGYVVKVDDPIAKNGRVSYIGDSNIVVRLFHLAPDGMRKYEDRNMLLSNKTKDPSGELIFIKGEKNPIIKNNNKDILPNTPAASAMSMSDPIVKTELIPEAVLPNPNDLKDVVKDQIQEIGQEQEIPAEFLNNLPM